MKTLKDKIKNLNVNQYKKIKLTLDGIILVLLLISLIDGMIRGVTKLDYFFMSLIAIVGVLEKLYLTYKADITIKYKDEKEN